MAQPHVSVRITDSEGYTATTDAYVAIDPSNTLAAINTSMGNWMNLVKNATGGRITEAKFVYELDVSSHAADAIQAGSAVSACTALIFPNVANSAPWDFIVPARNSGTIVSGGPDLTEGSTLDLLSDYMEVAIAGLTASNFTTNDGNALSAPAGGRRATRKHRKQLQSRSRRVGV